ncbi:preprotein translocase subunit SecG [Keratinibaculum paraultunense]|uniref:Protein-export membrane protein SecG n=1 Tax=Keratinibaculum paraultunense TaxID=1278232 RepID=A0A4R3KSG5_9FIRM|nr:preprotein translocase subunit SecG [Keratinibaculum paraultunense]QQY78832.1 preprotein translocase subunit SecG [Keratinibaculum paraultunense]TCS87457.1 preprotein translocase subunit SecG [Keratinibaculum paraultunense]
MTIFFSVLILISSILLIVTVLFQESKSEGLGAISGGAEKIWGKTRARTMEATLRKITTISAIVFMISAIVLAAIQ